MCWNLHCSSDNEKIFSVFETFSILCYFIYIIYGSDIVYTTFFLAIAAYKPTDATTNPSLILQASQKLQYARLIDEVVAFANKEIDMRYEQTDKIVSRFLIVNFLFIFWIHPF